jgi:hypothetical protein
VHRRDADRLLDVHVSRQPTNEQLDRSPENWRALRTQWEYSHAASAVLNLIALTALILAVLRWDQ